MKNNKGISIVSLVITIIVIIILASIGIANSLNTVNESEKAVFLEDFKSCKGAIDRYDLEAVYKANDRTYALENLQWDGEEERVHNSAKIEDPDQEDRIDFIFDEHYTKNVKGKLAIKDGKLVVRDPYLKEQGWAEELHLYKTGN